LLSAPRPNAEVGTRIAEWRLRIEEEEVD
jgi:hypothetical protein